MISHLNNNPNIALIASKQSWIEGDAIQQLQKTSELEGMKYVVGLPDLHPGRGNPVGAAFISQNIIYPYLVGNDVGCGIALFMADIKKNKIKKDKWINKLTDFDLPYEDDLTPWQNEFGLKPSIFDVALGTIGGGNHFCELQIFEKVHDHASLNELKIDKNFVCVLVHSGSRSMGDALLRRHTEKYGAKGLLQNSDDAQAYLKGHDEAIKWAKCNRTLIAHRFVSKIGAACNIVIDACHNSITRISDDDSMQWLHRKGAAPSDSGTILIPGSRGTLSYLVKPIGNQKLNAYSLAHGAGRKWNRGSCKGRLQDKYEAKALIQSKNGNYVICEDKELLYEKAPQAYKNIDVVIDDMVQAGLIEVIATLNPILTYKMRKER